MPDKTILEQQADILAGNITGWEQSAINRIAKRIGKTGKMTLSDVKSLNNVATVKQDMKEIVKDLADVTRFNVSQIENMYADVIEQQHLANEPLYDFRNKTFVPIDSNKELQAIVKAYARTTAENMVNLSSIGASHLGFLDDNGNFCPLEKFYTDALDKATLQIASGATNFYTAMRDVIVAMGGNGMRINYGSGVTRRLDTAVRQSLLWGAKQASVEYNELIGEQLGCDGIEIDWHQYPRPSHEFMQGKQYILGKEKIINGVKFESADKALEALGEYGCLHYKTPIICGVSEPTYSKKELERLNEQNKRKFVIDGKEYTGYEASQAMRRIETSVRNQKSIREAAKQSGDVLLERRCTKSIKAYQKKYNEISEITGIPPEPRRMSITKGLNTVKSVDFSGNSGIIKEGFKSDGDPMFEVTGPAMISNPKEIEEFKKELESNGVELLLTDDEKYSYCPAVRSGKPGQLHIYKDASYSAWCHEMKHMRDDMAARWQGMRILEDIEECYRREKAAYDIEIELAYKANRPDIAKRLKENLEKRRLELYGEIN